MSYSKLLMEEIEKKVEKKEEKKGEPKKPHSWGEFTGLTVGVTVDGDPIQKLIDKKELMIKEGKSSKEELVELEKKIWDAIYKKRTKKLFFG